MKTTEQIKQISISDVADKLWLQYKLTGINEYRFIDWWNLTDWWTMNTDKWLVRDHANKGRPQWDQFWFAKSYLRLDDKDTFIWFEESFWLEKQQTISDIWRQCRQLDEKQVDYLKSRWVDYDKVRDVVRSYNWWIWCLVYDWEMPKWLTARTLNQDHSKRFISASWFSTKWIYKHKIDSTKNYLIVVEWLIDFLTLRQFDTNVVWLKSASDWVEQIERLAQAFDIIYIPDNDDSGESTKKQFEKINHKILELADFEYETVKYKDINDLYKDFSAWDEAPQIIEFIKSNAVYNSPIKPLFQELENRQKVIKKQGKLGIDWPFKIYDDCQWIIAGKVYWIAAYSNTGKSKLAYHHATEFLKMGKKVLFINLEVDSVWCLVNIISSMEMIDWYTVSSEHKPDKKLYKNLIVKDNIFTLDDIQTCVKSYQADIVFIDFVQNIDHKWSDYEKHSTIARTIQRIAIETQCSIFSLMQLPNSALEKIKTWNFDEVTIKWAGEYFASSDVIWLLSKDSDLQDWHLRYTCIKNKFWVKKSYDLWVDYVYNRFAVMSEIQDI